MCSRKSELYCRLEKKGGAIVRWVKRDPSAFQSSSSFPVPFSSLNFISVNRGSTPDWSSRWDSQPVSQVFKWLTDWLAASEKFIFVIGFCHRVSCLKKYGRRLSKNTTTTVSLAILHRVQLLYHHHLLSALMKFAQGARLRFVLLIFPAKSRNEAIAL